MDEKRVRTEDTKQLRVVLVAGEGGCLAGIDGFIRVESESIQVD